MCTDSSKPQYQQCCVHTYTHKILLLSSMIPHDRMSGRYLCARRGLIACVHSSAAGVVCRCCWCSAPAGARRWTLCGGPFVLFFRQHRHLYAPHHHHDPRVRKVQHTHPSAHQRFHYRGRSRRKSCSSVTAVAVHERARAPLAAAECAYKGCGRLQQIVDRSLYTKRTATSPGTRLGGGRDCVKHEIKTILKLSACNDGQ